MVVRTRLAHHPEHVETKVPRPDLAIRRFPEIANGVARFDYRFALGNIIFAVTTRVMMMHALEPEFRSTGGHRQELNAVQPSQRSAVAVAPGVPVAVASERRRTGAHQSALGVPVVVVRPCRRRGYLFRRVVLDKELCACLRSLRSGDGA